MASPLTSERVIERRAALVHWLAAGGDVDQLLQLDQRVHRGLLTEWPGWETWWRRLLRRRPPTG